MEGANPEAHPLECRCRPSQNAGVEKKRCRTIIPTESGAAPFPLKGNRRSLCALLVDDLLEQVGGCLGEGELAEARIHGGEVGVEDLVEGVVLHVHSFSAALCLPFAAILFSLVSLCLDCRHVIPVAACHSD